MGEIINVSGLVPVVETVIADTTAVVSTINTVAADITKTSSSIKTVILYATLAVVAIWFLFNHGCIHLPSFNIAPTIVNSVASVKVSDTTVTYLTNTKNAKPITVYKPFESSPTLINGKLTIPHLGFCFEPQLSYSFTIADQLRPYLSARVIYLDNFGFDLGINDRRGFAGISCRIPVINACTISAGESLSYQLVPEPYAGLSIQLAL